MGRIITILFMALMLLVIPLASAFEEGQIVTQGQLDNFNTDDLTYVELQCHIGGHIWFRYESIIQDFSCLGLDKYEGNYLVVRNLYYTRVSLWGIVNDYRNGATPQELKDNYGSNIKSQAKRRVDSIKHDIRRLQTKDNIEQMVQNWLEDMFG